jgi:hypothetical protein
MKKSVLMTKILVRMFVCCALLSAFMLIGKVALRAYIENCRARSQHATEVCFMGSPKHILIARYPPNVKANLILVNLVNKFIRQYGITINGRLNIHLGRDDTSTLCAPRKYDFSRIRFGRGSRLPTNVGYDFSILSRSTSGVEESNNRYWSLTDSQFLTHLYTFDVQIRTVLNFSRSNRFLPLKEGDNGVNDSDEENQSSKDYGEQFLPFNRPKSKPFYSSRWFGLFFLAFSMICSLVGVFCLLSGLDLFFTPPASLRSSCSLLLVGLLLLGLCYASVWHGLTLIFYQ